MMSTQRPFLFSLGLVTSLFAAPLGGTAAAEEPPPDLLAASVSGALEATVDSTTTVNFMVLNVGGEFTGSFDYEILLSADTLVDESDLVVASGSLSILGSHAVIATIPAEITPGTYNWSLRVAPVAGESVTSNNSMVLSSIAIYVIDLALSGASSYTVEGTAGGGDPALLEIGVLNSGSANGVLIFTVTEVPGASWLSVSPTSSFALAGGAPQPVTLTFSTAGLVAGQYSTNLLIQNYWDSGDYEVVEINLVLGEPTFVVGDLLVGEIDGAGEIDEAVFEGLAGMKLKLDVSTQTGNVQPRVSLLDGEGALVEEWTFAFSSKTVRKNVKLPASGLYRLRIAGADGSIGAYTIQTSRKLKGHAKSFKETVKADSGEDHGSVEILALAGTSITLLAKPKGSLPSDDLSIALYGPDLDPIDIETATQAQSDGSLVVTGLLLASTGDYRLDAGTFASTSDKVKVEVTIEQPAEGDGTLILE